MGKLRLSLEGKVALVTGGSRGIGRAIALALAGNGADVAVAARSAEGLEATCKEIEQQGRRTLAVPTDLESQEDLANLAAKMSEEFGRIDILVNNAGIVVTGGLSRVKLEDFDKIMRVNVWAPLHLAQLCYGAMKDQGSGVVVNIVSNEGIRPSTGQTVYPASKAALINITKVMAKEWAAKGIRAVAVAPGLIRTDMGNPLVEYIEKQKLQLSPLGPAGDPEDIAAMVALLASDAAKFMTGETYVVDGGEMVSGPLG